MDRKYILMEKYYDGEITENEYGELNEMLRKDSNFRRAFEEYGTVIEDIRSINMPHIESSKESIMNIIRYVDISPSKKWKYTAVGLISYSVSSIAFLIYHFRMNILRFFVTSMNSVFKFMLDTADNMQSIVNYMPVPRTALIVSGISVLIIGAVFIMGFVNRYVNSKGGNR
ncbi:MAG: hypothetical protein SVK54_01675 [candidate division WOR-3 bacterium]|nr:hypothetical protein [candidate division WOR-3 bacterium]